MKARVLIFTGDGKGKTTAALGMAMRASGHGMQARIIQFIKSNSRTGELAAAQYLPGVEIVQTGLGFVPKPGDPRRAEHVRQAQEGLRLAVDTVASGKYDLVILDEICTAIDRNLVDETRVVELMREARGCLVLTGRGARAGLMEHADTVTEMNCLKHGYRSGVKAQKGVEF